MPVPWFREAWPSLARAGAYVVHPMRILAPTGAPREVEVSLITAAAAELEFGKDVLRPRKSRGTLE